MPAIPLRHSRLTGALLLALALPLSAQSPEPEIPAEDATADMAEADPGLDAAPEESVEPSAPVASIDPVLLDAEILPRASRSLLLDAVRTNAGYFAVGERGHVLVSEDGQAWTQAQVPTRATLTTIATADGVLWAAGHDGVIVHSTDGGQTWTRRRAAPWSYDIVDPSEGVPVMDLLFTDARNGFAIGAYSLMLVTSDGGVTWTPRSVLDKPEAEAPAQAEAPAADDELAAAEEAKQEAAAAALEAAENGDDEDGEEDGDAAEEEAGPTGPDPQEVAARMEAMGAAFARFQKSYAKQGPSAKAVLKAREEIAEILNLTENNLRVKIHRIKKQLTEIYNSYARL